jgi:hypothetical protein
MSRDYETYELAQRGDRAQLPAAGETGYGGGFDYVKHRAVRVLTRLPELFYALGRHWFLILVCVGLAGVASWYVVLSLPLVYEGRAQIVSKVRDTEE